MLRSLLLALALAAGPFRSLWAQSPAAPVAPVPAATAPATTLPDVGAKAALPDDAPPLLEWIDRQDLQRHVYWLADDARAGRFTASKGQQETARYVADHFKQLGLKPLGDKRGYLQTYPLHRRYLDPTTHLSFGNAKIATGYAVLPGKEDKVVVSGRLLFCGRGRADQVPDGLAGKLPVVLLDKAPRGGAAGDLSAIQLYRDLARRLQQAGASAGVVLLQGDPGALGNTLNYHAVQPDHARLGFGGKSRGEDLAVPLFVMAGAGRQALLDHLGIGIGEDGTPTEPMHPKATGKLNLLLKSDDKGSASNVVAVLEGTSRKSEAVVFSAHHDHVGLRLDGDAFNGADDNASGTAGLLEIAEAFARGPARPVRSIVFLSVSGEELGLWGSAWFSDNPTWPLDRIVANVNIDMIGRAGTEGDRIALQVTPSKEHKDYSTLVRSAAQLAPGLGIALSSGDAYYTRSDHFNFARKGIPVVFFCDGEHPDYHQVTDAADRLHYDRMEAIARLACWTGWLCAEAREKPRELGPQTEW